MPTGPFESLSLDQLNNVTGGCKKSPPPPPQEESAPQVSTNVQVLNWPGVAPTTQSVG